MIALLLLLLIFILLLAGFPVAFTLGGASLLFGWIFFGPEFFALLPLRIWGIMTNYVLLAVPLFVFMGVMLEKSGIAEELLESMALLFGRFRGGLVYSVIIVGALLAASTGIVGATVATMGLMGLPIMLKRGYSPELACGTVAASGTLGQIIPPSIVLILLGSTLNVPVGDMFMGAVIPGLLLVFLYLLYILLMALFKPDYLPALHRGDGNGFGEKEVVRRLIRSFFPPFLLVVSVLGSIFAGIASPTEAAGVGALGAVVLTAYKRKLSLEVIKGVARETAFMTSMVFTILVGATAFTLVFRGLGGDAYLSDMVAASSLGPTGFLVVVMLVIFIAGFFIDFIEIIFILVPVVAPILIGMEVNPLWFGILMALNLQTSFLTPPFGFALFYLKGVAPPEIKTRHLYRGAIPFIGIQLICLLAVIVFPELVTGLPAYLSGR